MLKLDSPIVLSFFSVTAVAINFKATTAVLTVSVLTEAEVAVDSHALTIVDNGMSTGLRPSKQGIVEEFAIDLPTGYTDLLAALSNGKAAGGAEQAAEQWASGAGVLPPGQVE